jgi:hypothetical protein
MCASTDLVQHVHKIGHLLCIHPGPGRLRAGPTRKNLFLDPFHTGKPKKKKSKKACAYACGGDHTCNLEASCS